MLEDYSVDTENFNEIMEEAKNMVVSLYPEWTDFNYHDPGITMLELFAWIKEGQQYFMDQIGEEHKKKYLKLLGIKQKHRSPAHTYVNIQTQKDFTVLRCSKLAAGDVVFETLQRHCIVNNRITNCFHAKDGIRHICVGNDIEQNGNLRLPIFGWEPKASDRWYVGFETSLPTQENIGIYLKLSDCAEDGSKRNPIYEPLPAPLLTLRFEYFSDGEWKCIEQIQDDTYGMLQSGMLHLWLKDPMEYTDVFGKEGYFIRVSIEKSDIDIPPVLERIRLNVVPVKQLDTRVENILVKGKIQNGICRVHTMTWLGAVGVNHLYIKRGGLYELVALTKKNVDPETGRSEFEFELEECEGKEAEILIVSYDPELKKKKLGIGTGMPYQEFELPSEDVLCESTEILVHEIGTTDRFAKWTRVEDFAASTPEDKHFMVDAKNGLLCFGDCERGMAPEGEILLISFSQTSGKEGRVKKGTIDRFVDIEEETIQVWNEQDAVGGRNEESIEECFFRARKWLKAPDTAVTYQDYEKRVLNTPGLLISSCKAISKKEMRFLQENEEDNSLAIVVKSAKSNQKEHLSESYRRNILAYLEPYRFLGLSIQIISPRYIGLEMSIEVVVKPHYKDAKEQIQHCVEKYFSQLSEQFGAAIVYSELYGIIDMMECVASVNDITLDIRDGRIIRTQDGNVLLPPNGVIVLGDVQYILSLSD